MLKLFKREKLRRISVTLNEAFEIMSPERVVKIHDAVQFLGSDPQTVESAIDLAISADDLQACRDDYFLFPNVGTPQAFFRHYSAKGMITSTLRGIRTSGRITERSFEHTPPGYRLIRRMPLRDTFNKDFSAQDKILARQSLPEKVACAHIAAFATLMLHELRGVDITDGHLLRTSEKVGDVSHVALQLISGKISFEIINRAPNPHIGAMGEVLL